MFTEGFDSPLASRRVEHSLGLFQVGRSRLGGSGLPSSRDRRPAGKTDMDEITRTMPRVQGVIPERRLWGDSGRSHVQHNRG